MGHTKFLYNYCKPTNYRVLLIFAIFAFVKHSQNLLINFSISNYIPIGVKMQKLLVSNIQNLQNIKFYSCQTKLVYSTSDA